MAWKLWVLMMSKPFGHSRRASTAAFDVALPSAATKVCLKATSSPAEPPMKMTLVRSPSRSMTRSSAPDKPSTSTMPIQRSGSRSMIFWPNCASQARNVLLMPSTDSLTPSTTARHDCETMSEPMPMATMAPFVIAPLTSSPAEVQPKVLADGKVPAISAASASGSCFGEAK